MLQKQTVRVEFTGQQEKRGSKHLPPGKLTLAENVQQSKTKQYSKRLGHALMTRACDYTDAELTTLTTSIGIAAVGGELALRTGFGVYTYDADDAKWVRRGEAPRTTVTERIAIPAAGRKVTSAFDSVRHRVWTFAVGDDGNMNMSVYDTDADQMTVPAMKLTISGETLNDFGQMSAFYDATGDAVWLIYTRVATNAIASIKLDCSLTPAYWGIILVSPTVVWDPSAGTIIGIDVTPVTVNGPAILAYGAGLTVDKTGWSGAIVVETVAASLVAMYLDTSTGSAKASTGVVGVVPSDVLADEVDRPVYYAAAAKNSTTSAIAFCDLQVYAMDTSDPELPVELMAWYAGKLTLSTLARAYDEKAWEVGNLWVNQISAAAWTATGGTSVSFIATGPKGAGDYYPQDMKLGIVTAALSGAAATVEAHWILGHWVASEPFFFAAGPAGLDATKVHVVLGRAREKDAPGDYGELSDGAQNSYNVYRLSRLSATPGWAREIIARVAYGRAGDLHSQDLNYASYASLPYLRLGPPMPVAVHASDMWFAGQEYLTGVQRIACLFDVCLSPTDLGPVVQDGDSFIFPGAYVSQMVRGRVGPMGPTEYPPSVSVSDASGGALTGGSYGFAAVYAIAYPDGRVTRSAPSPTLTQSVAAGKKVSFTVPTMVTQNQDPSMNTGIELAVECAIELYMTRADGTVLFLIGTVANDPHQLTVMSASISDEPAIGLESLYTTGGALENVPAPPFRLAFAWQDRLLLTGTDVPGDVWPSQQAIAGVGRQWNEILTFNLQAGSGPITAGGVVDYNYCALFKRDSIWVISGAGPGTDGSNNYVPQRLAWQGGTTNPNVATTPIGLFFQSTDGGIWLIGHDLSINYVGAAVDDYKAYAIVAAVTVPTAKHVRFHLSSGTILVYDYGNPTAEDPNGQWYVWTGLPMATGACVYNDVHYWSDASGYVHYEVPARYYDGASTTYLPRLVCAPIRFSGIQGWQRVYRGHFLGEYLGAHTLRISTTQDDGQISYTVSKAFVAGGRTEVEFRPATQRMGDLQVTIEQTGTDNTAAFAFDALAFEIGVKDRLKRLNTTSRM